MAKKPQTESGTPQTCRRHGGLTVNCDAHKGARSHHRTAADRREAVASKQEERDGRTALDQLDLLDERLGFGLGATRERTRLKARLTKEEKAELERRLAELAPKRRRRPATNA